MAQASKKQKIIAITICLIVIGICSYGFYYFLPSDKALIFSSGIVGGTIPLSILVYDTMHERKRKSNVKSQTTPVQIKPRIIVFLERNEVCAGDSPQCDTTLKVEDFDDFISHLKHHYLPVVLGDVRWFAHLYSLNGPVIFRLVIPLVGECKVYDVAPDSWLTDGVSIYMEYDF